MRIAYVYIDLLIMSFINYSLQCAFFVINAFTLIPVSNVC